MSLEVQKKDPIDRYIKSVSQLGIKDVDLNLDELRELSLERLISGREEIMSRMAYPSKKDLGGYVCVLTMINEIIKKKEFDVIPEPTTATVGPLDKSLDNIIIDYKVEHLFCLELIFSMLELADKLKLCLKRFVQEEE